MKPEIHPEYNQEVKVCPVAGGALPWAEALSKPEVVCLLCPAAPAETWPSSVQVFCNGEEVLTVSGTKKEYVVDVWSGNHPFYQVLFPTYLHQLAHRSAVSV